MVTQTKNPFNQASYLDANLREVPVNKGGMLFSLRRIEAQLNSETDAYERMYKLAEAAHLWRILGDLDKAEAYVNTALAASNELRDKTARLLNLMCLAQIHQQRGDFLIADRIYEQIIIACEARQDASRPGYANSMLAYLDQAYQAYGLSLFHQKRYELAQLHFERALMLRCDCDDEMAIEESCHALNVTRDCQRALSN